jgi:diguanylate cyclase (GGDEF)-like protein/PAS domain S-box-containing protein/putative nucleotidyltransferase with HDIG domain
MDQMHRLLKRQIARHLGNIDPSSAEWHKFVEAVNEAYIEHDKVRILLERSLELNSQELQAANSKVRAVYQELINSSMEGIFAFDCDCHYTVWNPEMERIFGISKLQVIGKCAFDIFPNFIEDGEERYFRDALAGRKVTIVDRPYIVPQANVQQYFECYYAPLLNEKSEIIGGLGIFHDMTNRIQAEEAQRRRMEYLSALQETALQINSRLQLTRLIEEIISRTEILLGTSHIFIALGNVNDSFRMQYCSGMFHQLKDQHIYILIEPDKLWYTNESFIFEDNTRKVEGTEKWIGIPLINSAQIIGFFGVACTVQKSIFNEEEIALLKQIAQLISIALNQEAIIEANERLASMAYTDPLTGLPNHRMLMGYIDEKLASCKQTGEICSLLFIDLDHFKHVNDTWGHQAGDAVLRDAAQRLTVHLRSQDFVGRYGGEEFTVVITNTDLEMVLKLAEQIRTAFASTPCIFTPEEGERIPISIPITASIGVATSDKCGSARKELIQCADGAMYHAKQTGRNRVCLASEIQMSPNNMLLDRNVAETMAMEALVAVASEYDKNTADHSHRLIPLAVALASKMGCSSEEIDLIRLAAQLHDIGKVGIPHEILCKSGPLTAEEWSIMQQHPEIGRRILTRIGGRFEQVAQIVVAHHERWDGTGYPHGLSYENILLGARILSVVDSFDAMTSRRPYYEPITDTEARAELLRCAGGQFDPQIVANFISMLDEHNAERAA